MKLGNYKHLKAVFPDTSVSEEEILQTLKQMQMRHSLLVPIPHAPKNHRKRILQPLDDEFAKDFSEFDTLDELKESIFEQISERKEETAQETLCDALLTQIIENSVLELNPQTLSDLTSYLSPEEAKRQLQETMVLHAIAEAEHLTLSEDELAYAEMEGEDEDEIEGLKLELLCSKAIEWVLASADITD